MFAYYRTRTASRFSQGAAVKAPPVKVPFVRSWHSPLQPSETSQTRETTRNWSKFTSVPGIQILFRVD